MANTYTDNPQANHTLAADQPNIEHNFLYLANTLGTSLSATKDHQVSVGGVDTNSFEGRHLRVSLKDLGAQTYPGDGTDSFIFSRGGNLFWGNSAGNVRQLTTANAGANFGASTNGWTFLPGNLILQYGVVTTPGTSGTITFPIAFPTKMISITIGMSRTSSSSTQSVYIDDAFALGPSSVHYTSTSSNTNNIWWQAIGN